MNTVEVPRWGGGGSEVVVTLEVRVQRSVVARAVRAWMRLVLQVLQST